MAGKTEHELLIRAIVKDQVSGQLKIIEKELAKTRKETDAGTTSTKAATVASAQFVAIMGRVAGSLALAGSGFGVAALEIKGFISLMKEVVDQSVKMVEASQRAEGGHRALAAAFGDLTAQQEVFIKQQAAITGKSSVLIRDFQVQAANISKSLGVELNAVDDVTNSLTTAGLTLSKALNIPEAEAFDTIIGSLVGRTTGLEKLGVALTKENIAAEAAALGMDSVDGELTDAQRSMAIASITIREVEERFGEAARSSEELKEKVEGAKNQIEQFREELGDKLQLEIGATIEAFGGLEVAVVAVAAALSMTQQFAITALQQIQQVAAFLPGIDAIRAGAGALGAGNVVDMFMLEQEKARTAMLGSQAGLHPLNVATLVGHQVGAGLSDFDAHKAVQEQLRAMIAEGTSEGVVTGLAEAAKNLKGSKDGQSIQEIADLFRNKIAEGMTATQGGIADALDAVVDAQKALRDAQSGFDTGRTAAEEEDITRALYQREQVMRDLVAQEQIALEAEAERLGILKQVQPNIDLIIGKRKELVEIQIQEMELAEQTRKAQELVNAEIAEHGQVLTHIRGAVGDLATASVDAAKGIEGAFASAFENILSNIARAAVEMLFLRTLFAGLTGSGFIGAGAFNQFFGTTFSGKGNVFSGGDVVPFAQGGLISSPVAFPLNGGRMGVAGEAGAEAIMPLKRGAGGRLGVESTGGSGGSFVFAPTINAQPGQSPQEIAHAVMAAAQSDPSFRIFLTRLGGVS